MRRWGRGWRKNLCGNGLEGWRTLKCWRGGGFWQEIVRRGSRREGFFFWWADGFSRFGFELASGEANIFHAEGGSVFGAEKGSHFVELKGAGTASAEDHGLATRFVDHAVAIEASRDGEDGFLGGVSGDELGGGSGAEAAGAFHRIRGDQLDDAEAVMAVGDEGIHGGGDRSDLDGVGIVELAVGGEVLIEAWAFGVLDIDDGEAVLAVGDIGVGAGDIEFGGVGEADDRTGHGARVERIGEADDFEAVVIGDVSVLKLDGNRSGVAEESVG